MPNGNAAAQGIFELPGLVAAAEEKRYAPGEYVFQQGQEDPHFYLVVEGEIEIRIKNSDAQEKVIAHVRAGELLGEGALSGKTLKPASARAVTPLRVFALSYEKFQELSEHDPASARAFLLQVLGIVNERLKRSNVKLLALFDTIQMIHQYGDDLNRMASAVLAHLKNLVGAEEGMLALKNPFNHEFRVLAATTPKLEESLLKKTNSVASQSFSDDRGHFLLVPLKSVGALMLWRSLKKNDFDYDHKRLVELVADQAASSIADASHRAEEKAKNILHQKRVIL